MSLAVDVSQRACRRAHPSNGVESTGQAVQEGEDEQRVRAKHERLARHLEREAKRARKAEKLAKRIAKVATAPESVQASTPVVAPAQVLGLSATSMALAAAPELIASPLDTLTTTRNANKQVGDGKHGHGHTKRSRRSPSASSNSSDGVPAKKRRKARSRSRRRRRGRRVLPPDVWTFWPPPAAAADMPANGLPPRTVTHQTAAPGDTAAPAETDSPQLAVKAVKSSDMRDQQQMGSAGHFAKPMVSRQSATASDSFAKASVACDSVAPAVECTDGTNKASHTAPMRSEDEPISDSDGDLSDDAVFASLAAAAAQRSPVPEDQLEPSVREWSGPARTIWLQPQKLAVGTLLRIPKPIQRRMRISANSPVSPIDEDSHRDEPLEPVCSPSQDSDDEALPPLTLPLWGRTLEWLGPPSPLTLDASTVRDPAKRKSTEFDRRVRVRAAAGLASGECRGGDTLNPAPPSPRGPRDAVADAVLVAVSATPGAPTKNVRLVGWARPLLLDLVPGTWRDPTLYRGTEKSARQRRRKLTTLCAEQPPPAMSKAGAVLRALPASLGPQQAPIVMSLASAPLVALPAPDIRTPAPTLGCSLMMPGPPLQHLENPVVTAAPAALVSYTEGLAETIAALQTDAAPPDVAVRRLWVRLSEEDRKRFGAEFPQWLHYVS